MTSPHQAQLLDAADTEEERGNVATAARLREQADSLTAPWERLAVVPVPGEPTRFYVESQRRDHHPHICDAEEWQCGCEWGEQYRREGVERECAHLKRLRQWMGGGRE